MHSADYHIKNTNSLVLQHVIFLTVFPIQHKVIPFTLHVELQYWKYNANETRFGFKGKPSLAYFMI